jgi:uncharacterized protein (DUF1684 family)
MRSNTKAMTLSAAVMLTSLCAHAATISLEEERAAVEKWRTERVAELTNDTGYLTLAGLFWLKEGGNTFGRAKSNAIALDHPALAETEGTFVRSGAQARFVAKPGSRIAHNGKPVTTLELATDKSDEPTVLSLGSLQFVVIDRSGQLAVRVRDLENPRRTHFKGLEYFPIDPSWRVDARFEPYEPYKQIKIIDVVNMEQSFDSPGALVFTKNGREYRLDAVFQPPETQALWVMFADGTSGWESYGAGRYLWVPLPEQGIVKVDFNKSYNPPCAFNDFATCPLPPRQNRIKLRVEAGEKTYSGPH